MLFEWDPDKSRSNESKHGISFEEAQRLWDNIDLVEAEAITVEGEVRRATIGKIDDKLWVAIWTPRQGVVRFISVHRAEGTKYEKKYYEKI